MKFQIFKGEDGQYFWRFLTLQEQVTAISPHGYTARSHARMAITQVKASWDAPVEDMPE